MKMSYKAIVTFSLARMDAEPGDIIAMTLRNENQGMYEIAKRLNRLFLDAFRFWPDTITMHPDHLVMLKKQGKSLDIILDEKMCQLLENHMDYADLPRSVPFIADESLDLFTAVAKYHFSEERTDEFIDLAEQMVRNMFQ